MIIENVRVKPVEKEFIKFIGYGVVGVAATPVPAVGCILLIKAIYHEINVLKIMIKTDRNRVHKIQFNNFMGGQSK